MLPAILSFNEEDCHSSPRLQNASLSDWRDVEFYQLLRKPRFARTKSGCYFFFPECSSTCQSKHICPRGKCKTGLLPAFTAVMFQRQRRQNEGEPAGGRCGSVVGGVELHPPQESLWTEVQQENCSLPSCCSLYMAEFALDPKYWY